MIEGNAFAKKTAVVFLTPEETKPRAMTESDEATPVNHCTAVIMDAFEPLFKIERLFGVVKLRFRCGAVRAPRVRERLLAAATTVFYLSLTYFSLETVSFNVVGAVSIELLPKCCMILQFITVIAAYMCCHGNSNMRIYQGLVKIDLALRINAYDETIYKSFKKTTVRYIIILVFFHVVFNALVEVDGVAPVLILSKKLGLLLLYFFQDSETLFFCRIMLFIRTRLELINKHIDKIAKTPANSKTGPSFMYKNIEGDYRQLTLINIQIPELASVYNAAAHVCGLVNSVYNLQLLWTLITIFSHIIVTIWACLRYYRMTLDNFEILIFISLWSISGLTNVVTICVSCERLQAARLQMRSALNEIIINHEHAKVKRTEAKSFSALLEARPLRVSVYSLVRVDLTLVLGFVSLATTYVIVILQISHFY